MRAVVLTGLRKGEVLALQWRHVDLDEGIVRVRGTLSCQGSELVITETKSDSSRRDLFLTPAACLVLRKVKAAQAADRLRAGPLWVESGHVFTTEVGTAIHPRNALRAVEVAARAAGLVGISMHTLRHTAASLMMEAGVPLKTVSEILGHSSISVTGDIYGHVSTDGARTAMQRLAEALGS